MRNAAYAIFAKSIQNRRHFMSRSFATAAARAASCAAETTPAFSSFSAKLEILTRRSRAVGVFLPGVALRPRGADAG